MVPAAAPGPPEVRGPEAERKTPKWNSERTEVEVNVEENNMEENAAAPGTTVARYGPWALIAGASEGVGEALAHRLAAAGLNLVLIARNETRLQEVAADIRTEHGREVRDLAVDLTDANLAESVTAACSDLDVGLLLYVAGGVNRTVDFVDDPYAASLRQIELNCIAPLALARAFSPAMLDRGRGGIVMVSSLAALAGAAQIAVFSGVKAFQVNLGEGMWAEMAPQGVDVCTAVLGQTWTPAMERTGVTYDPETDMLALEVADAIIANIANGPTYVVGARNQAIAANVWPDRRKTVEMISAFTSAHTARTKP
jgi:short-subunit dehydrogenase